MEHTFSEYWIRKQCTGESSEGRIVFRSSEGDQGLGSRASSNAGSPGITEPPGIGMSLHSKIDQALSIGAMKPEAADQRLKSYGCDLDELFHEEHKRGSSSVQATGKGCGAALGTPPLSQLLRASSAGACSPARGAVGLISGGSARSQPTQPGTPVMPPAGPPLDDDMLMRIDQALSSGAMRPDQAEQLLRSYGCDLEELMREELDCAPTQARGGSGTIYDSGNFH
ncbi:hypothetical protein GPECTOR_57g531 [Gonium pectorale]|uniref:Uncharacterized protein n=1 Tax=Gonium pectorale TaxID=33097 RepID=A0A150G5Y7_GONPE|nr:hypothetical protein GPECTOR_57g531 [Gonium pectorale]|eukprot:KXZ45241.1 hypothetical protein GPECTOR_57g531 [Gonium pectorale]